MGVIQEVPWIFSRAVNRIGLTRRMVIVSGGFATVQPGSQLSINAVEGYPLEDFSADAVRNQIAEAQKIAGGSGSEQDIAEAKIELEVSPGRQLRRITHLTVQ